MALSFGVLGPIEAVRDGVPLALGGPKQRVVLAMLLVDAGHVVSVDRLVDAVWGSDVPPTFQSTLQVYVSNLRRSLAGGDGASVLSFRRPGYVLDVDPEQVDLGRFRALVRAADALPDTEAAQRLTEALALWRGRALADVADEPFAAPIVARLQGERLAALERRIELDLQLGRHAQVVQELQGLVLEWPLREGLWVMLITAQYRSGQRGDALASFHRARTTLADELGLDPGPDLRDLERAILLESSELLLPREPLRRPSQVDTVKRTVADEHDAVAALVDLTGRRIPLGAANGRVVIGRADENDVVVQDASASRRHAMVRSHDGAFEIIDLDSTNGTAVNGVHLIPRDPRPLTDGDLIAIGTGEWRFAIERPAAEA